MRAFTISCWDEFPTSHPGIITSHQNVIIKAIHHAAKSDTITGVGFTLHYMFQSYWRVNYFLNKKFLAFDKAMIPKIINL